jgi:transcription elongation factor GreB
MSKAFVNDDAPAEEVVIQRLNLTDGAANHITSQGYEAYKKELEDLLDRRAAAAAQNSTADARIAVVKGILDSANVIDPARQNSDRVLFGATVTVEDEDGSDRIYKIVGVDETDAAQGKVSWISPIGKALLQARAGDEVTLRTPSKNEVLLVKKIEYKAIG